MELHESYRNIGLDLVRVTERTALASSRWIGSGDYDGAHLAADKAMLGALTAANIHGYIAIGEEKRVEEQALLSGGQVIGEVEDTEVDLAVDPIDGTTLLIKGRPGAISVMGLVPRGALVSLLPARYMDKIWPGPGTRI